MEMGRAIAADQDQLFFRLFVCLSCSLSGKPGYRHLLALSHCLPFLGGVNCFQTCLWSF